MWNIIISMLQMQWPPKKIFVSTVLKENQDDVSVYLKYMEQIMENGTSFHILKFYSIF